jgi:hypothetical protein
VELASVLKLGHALEMDVANMKVAELRSELERRGLDTTGKKQELQERLQKALEQEAHGETSAAEVVPSKGDKEAEAESAEHGTRPERGDQQSASNQEQGALEAGAEDTGTGNLDTTSAPRASAPAPENSSSPEKETRKLTDEELEQFLTPAEREEVAKTMARAARFGVPYGGLPAELRRAALNRYRKRRRFEKALEKHGGLVPVDEAEEERRRKRMERFGLSKPVLELEAEERERKRYENKPEKTR